MPTNRRRRSRVARPVLAPILARYWSGGAPPADLGTEEDRQRIIRATFNLADDDEIATPTFEGRHPHTRGWLDWIKDERS